MEAGEGSWIGRWSVHGMLGKKMRPGNWIGIEGWENFSIMLRLYGIHASKDTRRAGAIEQNLPTIKRLDCR